MTDVDVLVVGGGISGLATAWWLAREGLSTALWERERRPGGKIRSDVRGGYITERSATLLMSSRPEVATLVRAAGLDVATVRRAPAPKRYLVRDGRLVPVPKRLGGFVSSPLWSARAKLRLLAEPFVRGTGGEGETVTEFITRRLGRELLERAVEPYVAGPLASDPDRAQARAVLPRLAALEARFGSLAAGAIAHHALRRHTSCNVETISFAGGMGTLVETLATEPRVRLETGRAVEELGPAGDGWRASAGSDEIRARRVVLCTPAGEAAALLGPLAAEAARLLRGIEHAPIAVVHLGFARAMVRHPLDGTGLLFPRAERRTPTGCMWTSSLFPDRAPAGHVLLDCYLGGARHPEAAAWDEERSVTACLEALAPLLGIEAAPHMVSIDRHARGLPLYHGAHLARVRAVDDSISRLPGLFVAGAYDGGVSVRERIVQGCKVARRVAASLSRDAVGTPRYVERGRERPARFGDRPTIAEPAR